MHEYMTLHAQSNPLPSHSHTKHAKSAVWSVGHCVYKATTGDCTGAGPIYSVTEVLGNLQKMLKPWGVQEKYPFSLKCDSGGHHSTRGE